MRFYNVCEARGLSMNNGGLWKPDVYKYSSERSLGAQTVSSDEPNSTWLTTKMNIRRKYSATGKQPVYEDKKNQ